MKRALLVLLVIAVAGSAAARYVFALLLERPGPPPPAPIRIDVGVGEPFRTTARRLEAAGLVPSALALTLWARFKGVDRAIQHGAYQFAEALSPIALVDKMRSGEAMMVHVLLAEGATVHDLALTLEHSGLGPAERFVALAHDAAFARSLAIDADGLEGYLFPDTYFFSPLDGAEKVLAAFVGRFHKVFTPEMDAEARKAGFSVHQIVTLASVIEKETGARRGTSAGVGGVPQPAAARHATAGRSDGDLRDRELQRQPDAQGPRDAHALQHLHRAGPAAGADRQPGTVVVARRDSSGRRAVSVLRRPRGRTRTSSARASQTTTAR